MELREAVRKRPGMYVGSTDGYGVVTMIFELVANAVDQHLVGRCGRIAVTVDDERVVTVEDDGPGIDVGGTATLPPIVEVLTTLFGRPTVDGHRPHAHVGLGGVGLAAVNALCETFELTTARNGVEASIAFERGLLSRPLEKRRVDRPNGTRVCLRADREIFGDVEPRWTLLVQRLDDLAYVAPRLTIATSFTRAGTGGLPERIAQLDDDLLAIAHHRGRHGDDVSPVDVDLALAWQASPFLGDGVVLSYVNLERTRGDGQHVAGLQDGLRRWFGRAAWDAISPGLFAAVSVVLEDVIYGNPTKDRLDTPRARDAVAEATTTALDAWAAAHPDAADEMRRRIASRKRAARPRRVRRRSGRRSARRSARRSGRR